MAEGTITARGQSKNGKATITIDGQLHYAGNTDLGGLTIGDRIFYSATSFANGKLWGIDKGWKLLSAAPKYAPPPQSTPTQIAAPMPASTAPTGISEGERLTISNWVAAAITAGLIKDTADMGIWACAACQAIRFAGTSWPKGDLGDRLTEFLKASHKG